MVGELRRERDEQAGDGGDGGAPEQFEREQEDEHGRRRVEHDVEGAHRRVVDAEDGVDGRQQQRVAGRVLDDAGLARRVVAAHEVFHVAFVEQQRVHLVLHGHALVDEGVAAVLPVEGADAERDEEDEGAEGQQARAPQGRASRGRLGFSLHGCVFAHRIRRVLPRAGRGTAA